MVSTTPVQRQYLDHSKTPSLSFLLEKFQQNFCRPQQRHYVEYWKIGREYFLVDNNSVMTERDYVEALKA